jgi:hypothetical protein
MFIGEVTCADDGFAEPVQVTTLPRAGGMRFTAVVVSANLSASAFRKGKNAPNEYMAACRSQA